MQPDPIIYQDLSRRTEERRFQELLLNWKAGLVYIIVAMVWLIIKTDVRREPELPNRPFTKADIPLLKEKVKFLKSDADTACTMFPHLKNRAEKRTANQAWEDVYYTPEVFPVAQELHRIQYAQVLAVRPDLADHVRAKQAYEQGRYEIANNPAITDKAAAYDALKDRIGPEVKDPEYSKNADQAQAILTTLIGDPELDRAEQAYENACAAAVLKRHPELAEYYREQESSEDAYNFFMAQANDLSRKITALENGTDAARTADAKPKAPAGGNITGNPSASVSVAPLTVPHPAVRYGVVVGDVVDISAVTPPIALHRATLTAMDNDQLTVRAGDDTFNVRWGDLINLKETGGRR